MNLYGSQEQPDIHHNNQDTTIYMRRIKEDGYELLMILINKDVNGRCYKQINLPNNKIIHVYIYVLSCTIIMHFTKAKQF